MPLSTTLRKLLCCAPGMTQAGSAGGLVDWMNDYTQLTAAQQQDAEAIFSDAP